MKNNRTIIAFLVITMSLCANFALADDGFMISRSWKIHERGITDLLENWRMNKPESTYEKALADILSAESNLGIYGTSLKEDTRLVGRLFEEDGGPVSLQKFAAKVFFHNFEQNANWTPNLTTLFKDKEYIITPTNRTVNTPNTGSSFDFSS